MKVCLHLMELFYETRFWRFVQIFQILYKQKPNFWDYQIIKTDGKFNINNSVFILLQKMPNIKQRKANKARIHDTETCEFFEKQKKEEEDKNRKKSQLISSFRSVLTELFKEQDRIQLDIDLCIKEHILRLEKQMRSLTEKSSTDLYNFQIDESFMVLFSVSKLRLEEISKQTKFIDDLIQKVSSDLPDIEISEHEQKIIEILSAKSFFISPDVVSVRKMIDSCSNMRDCLERSKTYLDTFISEMIDFTVDSKRFKLEHQNLDQLLQELSELTEEIEKRNFHFSTESLVECIFSIKSDEFSSISEDTQTFQDRIKEMKKRFSDIKKSLVDFVESQISYRQAFIREINRSKNDYDCRSDDENDSTYEEPIVDFRKDLERSLNQIRSIRV